MITKKHTEDDLIFTFYDIEDIQRIFKISRYKAYRLVNSDGFPKMKIGGSIRVNALELKKYIEKKYNKNIHLD